MAHHVTDDGTRLVVDDLGEGEPVVLLHGWSLDRASWEYQVPALLGSGGYVWPTTGAATAAPTSPRTVTTQTPSPTISLG